MGQRLRRIACFASRPPGAVRRAAGAVLAVALLLHLPLLGGGCDERVDPLPPVTDDEISVLATVYALADVARQVGGPGISVEWVAESGQPLPPNEASPELRGRTDQFDFVISAGEQWAVPGYDDPFRSQRVVRIDMLPSTADLLQAQEAGGPRPGLLWLDPVVARELTDELVTRFSQRRLRQQPDFRARADRFIEELERLTRSYEPVLKTSPPRKALVLADDWNRLLDRFAIEPLRPVAAQSPSSLTASQLRDLTETARKHRITSLFVAADTPPAVVQDLQRKTDLTVLTLDPLGTSARGGRNTYIDILRYNLDQLNRGASPAR